MARGDAGAAGHGERAALAEVVLDVDDDQGAAGVMVATSGCGVRRSGSQIVGMAGSPREQLAARRGQLRDATRACRARAASSGSAPDRLAVLDELDEQRPVVAVVDGLVPMPMTSASRHAVRAAAAQRPLAAADAESCPCSLGDADEPPSASSRATSL